MADMSPSDPVPGVSRNLPAPYRGLREISGRATPRNGPVSGTSGSFGKALHPITCTCCGGILMGDPSWQTICRICWAGLVSRWRAGDGR